MVTDADKRQQRAPVEQPSSKKALLGHQGQLCTAALDSEGHFDLCSPNRGQLGLEVAPALVAFLVFLGGRGACSGKPNNTSVEEKTLVSQLGGVFPTLSHCACYVSERGSENLSGSAHVTITKEVLRIVTYSNEEHVSLSFFC